MTLLEIIAVTMIVGLVSLTAVTRFSSRTIADTDGQGFARRLALDCHQARRRAIGLGDNHLLRFTQVGGNATQYGLYRRQGAAVTLVDDLRVVPASVTVTTGGTADVEFKFTGEALASYAISVATPDRTWNVAIPQATGRAFVD